MVTTGKILLLGHIGVIRIKLIICGKLLREVLIYIIFSENVVRIRDLC